MKLRILALGAAFGLIGTSPVLADVIIDDSTPGHYNDELGDLHLLDGNTDDNSVDNFLPGPFISEGDPTTDFTADPGLEFDPNSAFGNDWLNGDFTGTGSTWSTDPVAIPSTWEINEETAIVYSFDLASTSDLHIDVGVDNGVFIWLNGDFLFGATAPGGASLDEYNVAVSNVEAGSNFLAILRADHGGSTGFSINVTAKSVPEPGTLALLGLGLVGLGVARRRGNS